MSCPEISGNSPPNNTQKLNKSASGKIALGQASCSYQFHWNFFVNKTACIRSVFQFPKFFKCFDSQSVGVLVKTCHIIKSICNVLPKAIYGIVQ